MQVLWCDERPHVPRALRRPRCAVEALITSLTDACASFGLPIIGADDEALWTLVGPVSSALRDAGDTLQHAARSTRKLDQTRQRLLAAAVALSDPAAHAERQGSYRRHHLPIVVPGPDGSIPGGLIDCELEDRTRVVRWYPEGWTR